MRRDIREVLVAWTIGLLSMAAAAALLVGCAADSPAAPTEPMIVFSGAATAHHVDRATDLWYEVSACMVKYHGRRSVGQIEVEVQPGGFLCGSTWAAGCTWWGFRIKVSAEEPVYTKALAHEFIHVIEMKAVGVADYKHESAYWPVCDWRNNG